MKNRVLLLCVKHGIETSLEYSRLVGISEQEALSIIKEQSVIPIDVVNRTCELFNVDAPYLLCEI